MERESKSSPMGAHGRSVPRRLRALVRCQYHRLFHNSPFRFDGAEYAPFFHVYNKTWTNERIVEVPILWKQVQASADGRILEVGNVLSHYFPVRHDIVDKYERQEGVVLNADIVDFKPPHPYRLIVSISTLEHVGWDEQPREDGKIRRAVDAMKSFLEPGGRLMTTIPVGYNPIMDRLLDTDRAGFDRLACLKRVSKYRWVEAPWAEVRGARYGEPYPCANAVVVATFEKR